MGGRLAKSPRPIHGERVRVRGKKIFVRGFKQNQEILFL
jgi:hypothetical protein